MALCSLEMAFATPKIIGPANWNRSTLPAGLIQQGMLLLAELDVVVPLC